MDFSSRLLSGICFLIYKSLYGGDDISALIFDPGHHSLRVGYAQEDTPRAEIPAIVGVATNEMNEIKTDNYITQHDWKVNIGTTYLHTPQPNMDIYTYMEDGMIENWDLFETVLDYTYEKIMQSESKYHPVLFSESPWNNRSKRETLTEIMFEKYRVPAFFLVKNAVLTAFANCRPTALVVDSGATHTSAVPVLDGFVLTQAVVKSSLGGDYLVNEAQSMLENMGIDLTPTAIIANKEPVLECEKPVYTMKNLSFTPTDSWIYYMTKRTIEDFKQCVLKVSGVPYDEAVASSTPAVKYEFPTGYHQRFGPERFRLAEDMFDQNMLGAGCLVAKSLGMCDIDVRPAICNTIVVTGGNSLLQGFDVRLSRDLVRRLPGAMKFKLIAANDSAERRFGAWKGGSILASNGTFQQMWFSLHEYYESGRSLIDRKCP